MAADSWHIRGTKQAEKSNGPRQSQATKRGNGRSTAENSFFRFLFSAHDMCGIYDAHSDCLYTSGGR